MWMWKQIQYAIITIDAIRIRVMPVGMTSGQIRGILGDKFDDIMWLLDQMWMKER